MRADPDRPHAGSAAAMGNGEGLVQVHVHDVGAELPRTADPHEGVEVGAVQIDLPAMIVDDPADIDDRRLVHAVRRRVGNHQRGEPVGMLRGLRLQVGDIDVAVRVGGDDDHSQPRHVGARRIGAVCRGRDQAHVALHLAAAFVVLLDGNQAGVFPLGAGIGLEGDGVVAGAGGQHPFQILEQLPVAGRLIGGGERMDVGESRPGNGNHLRRGVEFHGARAQRDHGAVEGQVPVLQPFHVTHHLRLRVHAVEHRMCHEGAVTEEVLWQALAIILPCGRFKAPERSKHG